jgi:hypothetical protein
MSLFASASLDAGREFSAFSSSRHDFRDATTTAALFLVNIRWWYRLNLQAREFRLSGCYSLLKTMGNAKAPWGIIRRLSFLSDDTVKLPRKNENSIQTFNSVSQCLVTPTTLITPPLSLPNPHCEQYLIQKRRIALIIPLRRECTPHYALVELLLLCATQMVINP